jgi:L-lactate dehydrogenase complex protein LldG
MSNDSTAHKAPTGRGQLAGRRVAAREEVLARVRSALGRHTAEGPVSRAYRQHGEHPRGDPVLIDLLAERLTDYRAHVWRAASGEVARTVARALAHGLAPATARPRIVVPPQLPQEWVTDAEVDVVADAQLDAAVLDRCDGVVTAAAVAIAETGTIVLDGTPDQGRRAITLVPDLHVCVVRAEQVVATVPEGVADLDPTRPLTWISGPSATSDIELDRVEGVHGPRTLEVVLVNA